MSSFKTIKQIQNISKTNKAVLKQNSKTKTLDVF